MLEKTIEKEKVCKYAEKKGWLVYKFTSPGQRNVPDRIFMKNGLVFFIEFKAPRKEPSEAQYDEIEKIEKQGINVFVIDDVDEGEGLIDYFEGILNEIESESLTLIPDECDSLH